MAPVVEQSMGGQAEGLGRVPRIHGRSLQPVVLLHRLGDQRTDQHQGFGLFFLAAVQGIAHPAGKSLLQRPPTIGPRHLQLALADGLARRGPQGGRAQDGRAIEGLALDLSARHSQRRPFLQRQAQRLLPVAGAVQSLGQHVHRPARQGRDQGAVGAGSGGDRPRRPVARQDEQHVRLGRQRFGDLLGDARALQHHHLGLEGVFGQDGAGFFGRLTSNTARQRIDQDDDPLQPGLPRQRPPPLRRIAGRRRSGFNRVRRRRGVVLSVSVHGRRTPAHTGGSPSANPRRDSK